MTVMTAVVLLAGAGIVGFIGGYALVYLAGAALYVAYALCKPFRIVSMQMVAPR
jgi:hypothetical protein